MRQVLSRQVLGKGMLTAAAASSLLSIATGAASAHQATGEAAHSPGVLAGNNVSVPITFALNVCGNSVDGGAALNPAMGNTCATTTGSHAHDDHGRDDDRCLSPEHAEAFEHYLRERDERQGSGRHRGLPEQRHEGYGGGADRPQEPPRHRAEPPAPAGHDDHHHDGGGYGCPNGEQERPEEECDHPGGPGQDTPPPAPGQPHPLPQPRPQPGPEAQVPPPSEAHPLPTPVEEAPHTLPAPAPVEEAPAPRPPHGSQPVEHPAPAPADQPPAAPAGDVPVHLPPAPAPLPAPVPAPAPAQMSGPALAETGAGQPAAAAALASALILGGAILYRRSRAA